MKVALFVPCLTERFDGRVAEAMALLLNHLGVDVQWPTGQTCCGQPLKTLGDLAGAAKAAARMAKVFSGFDVIATPSSSCAGFVRHTDSSIAGRVFELSDVLVHHLGFDASRCVWPGRAALHPSCHQREVALTGRADHTRALLSRVQGLDLVELPRASQCCGFGGAFSAGFPEVSVALGRDKLDALAESGADTLIANDGGCRLHVRGTALGATRPLEVKHLAEILAEGLGLLPRPPRRAAGLS